MFELDWEYIKGIGYIRESTVKVGSMLSESYMVKGFEPLKEGDRIPDERFLEEYPNLKLARALGHKSLTGSMWAFTPYKHSYYFDVKLKLLSRRFNDAEVLGRLRISDHKASPGVLSDGINANPYTVIKGKKYFFCISIVFPDMSYKDKAVVPDDCEVHIFEHIFPVNTAKSEEGIINNLQSVLDKYVRDLSKVIEVGRKGYIRPPYYTERTNGEAIFDEESTDKEFARAIPPSYKGIDFTDQKKRGRKPGSVKKAEEPSQETPFSQYAGRVYSEVAAETGLEVRNLYLSKKGRGNSIPTITVGEGGMTYPVKMVSTRSGFYAFPAFEDNIQRIRKLDTGIYVWKNFRGNDICAAIVDGYNIIPLLLKEKPRRGRPPKGVTKGEIMEMFSNIVKELV